MFLCFGVVDVDTQSQLMGYKDIGIHEVLMMRIWKWNGILLLEYATYIYIYIYYLIHIYIASYTYIYIYKHSQTK